MAWFDVYLKDDRVVLEVFPYQPGGCTVYLPRDVAIDLARRLQEAAASDKKE